MNAEILETILAAKPRLSDLERERETACMAIREFNTRANEHEVHMKYYRQQEKLARVRLAELDVLIRQHDGGAL